MRHHNAKRSHRISQAAFLVVCLLATGSAIAEIYKSIDSNGNITYSDIPSGKELNTLDLPHINATPEVKEQQVFTSAPKPEPVSYSVNITSPSQGQEVLPGQRNLSVSASVSPYLPSKYSLQLFLDGKPYGKPQAQGQFMIPNITRGERKLFVALRDKSGRQISRSNNITVYVFRARI